MARKNGNLAISRRIGTFAGDRRAILILILFALAIGGWSWLRAHPEHDPWAPLDLRHPVGWATTQKLVALRDDAPQCRAVLERSDVAFGVLPAAGEGPCERTDRTRLTNYPLSPDTPATTCPVAAALEMWRVKVVEPAARDIFGSELARIEHLGVYNCRRMRGNNAGAWSQHATGNAIDIAAFSLADGRRISVIEGWDGSVSEARFLRTVRDGACGVFATTLSPDYNAAHTDHFHFDQDARWVSVCR
ncbi:extensin family protein [Erythrobacter sp. JK5]|uniref:extensin-like domain-containing protein n=1 Tax=Erythrobacter sp. JK5 TaxID=2829500 RepID=UPI001BAA473B|nr:extensin family protein [Erythrobacter sp. JK5]QUL38849.1 extensin family protein [Erythrobacter sp. JK5]